MPNAYPHNAFSTTSLTPSPSVPASHGETESGRESGGGTDVLEHVPAARNHEPTGDNTMQTAQVLSGNATTFLTHIFGHGLADDRYVVERFKAMVDGDIRPVQVEAPQGKGPTQGRSAPSCL